MYVFPYYGLFSTPFGSGLGPDAIEGQCAAIVPVINSLVGTLYDSSKDELFLSYFAVYAGTNPQHVWVS